MLFFKNKRVEELENKIKSLEQDISFLKEEIVKRDKEIKDFISLVDWGLVVMKHAKRRFRKSCEFKVAVEAWIKEASRDNEREVDEFIDDYMSK